MSWLRGRWSNMMDTVDTVTAMRRLVAVSMGTIEQPVRVEQQARDVLQAISREKGRGPLKRCRLVVVRWAGRGHGLLLGHAAAI
mmetsp:Transcript_51954/g.145864  ORF Transcript_51954/g.145864 Transcript_51954/m.145864 type:complete len:84 (+) Transcript_51954:247-498(+)